MNTGTKRKAILALVVGAFASGSIAAANPEPRVVQVNCSSGDTLARALQRGSEDRALVVVIQGVCNETVVIERSDVTLRGEAGAAITGPDPALDAVTVRADRVSIENLLISGGRNGLVARGAGNFVVQGTTVQSTGRTGILVVNGSGALIDGSTMQNNARDGFSVEGAQATVVNSTITQNARVGVFVGPGASGRVGIDNRNEAAGNTISLNGSSGVSVFGGSALIAANTVTLNGTDPLQGGRSGISVVNAVADVSGSNTITNNAAQGIFVSRSNVSIGSTAFSFSGVNTISGNGAATAAGGVSAFLGGTLFIRDAVISGNHGGGLILGGRSQAQVIASQIQNNLAAGPSAGEGIRLFFGSALMTGTPASMVTGNAGAGLACFDGESSVSNTALLGSAGNGAPDFCTGF
ncbi:MAG TPA: right-handed parallel beta-helix repeat-containing protein [Burkholderiales bacterium]